MGFNGGRGGPITVLLGLFIYLIIGAAYVLFWMFAAAVMLLLLAGAGVRALYLKHRRGREMHGPESVIAEPVEWTHFNGYPLPPTSPVEYRDKPRS